MRKLLTYACTLLALATVSPAPAQSPTPAKCSTDPAFHLLDFWVGAWEVVDAAGATAGSSHIDKILDGCAITESWHDADGTDGHSLFYYVPSQRQWKQVWVTPQALQTGGLKEKHLIAAAAGMTRFQGELIGPRGATILDRTTLTALPDGRVRQVIENSFDGGSTWKTSFDALYLRAKR